MNRFAAFNSEERYWIACALLRLANDTSKHGCREHHPLASKLLELVLECMEAGREAIASKEPKLPEL